MASGERLLGFFRGSPQGKGTGQLPGWHWAPSGSEPASCDLPAAMWVWAFGPFPTGALQPWAEGPAFLLPTAHGPLTPAPGRGGAGCSEAPPPPAATSPAPPAAAGSLRPRRALRACAGPGLGAAMMVGVLSGAQSRARGGGGGRGAGAGAAPAWH